MPYVLTTDAKFSPQLGEWCGIVAKIEGKVMTVLCIGREATQEAIAAWGIGTIALMRKEGRTDVQMPDMYDRAKAHH